MQSLPPSNTPLNQHSLRALECWLKEIGAQRSSKNPCLWIWVKPLWSAEILIEQDELKISWKKDGESSVCSFPYGLSRSDVEVAMSQGP